MKILILGSTGSIGKQALEVINNFDNFEICGISYLNNVDLAIEQINKYQIKYFYSENNKLNSNVESYNQLIKISKPDLIINAISGYEGMKLTFLCIENKIDIALANKESLVMAGAFIKKMANDASINIYPIDSEHSSLFELLKNQNPKDIKNIYITCSGGRYYNNNDITNISFEEAIKHPNWNMGYKISIDSSTLINKCFEIIEAYWLFNTKNIIPLYHPQSIVHSLIEFNDNSIYANMSSPDMKIAIESAINKFNKNMNKPLISPLNFTNLNLTFDYINEQKWKPIKWAYDVIYDKNNSLGVIINVSNDIAIELFKNNKIKFNQIIPFIEDNIKKYREYYIKDINDIFNLIQLIKNESDC